MAVKNLHTVAIVLGHENTRNELLPYITDLVDDEEKVLCALAESLGGLLDYIGGYSYAIHLLKPLESLCAVDEKKVRDCAISSIITILKNPEIYQIEDEIMDILNKLANGDWFTSKTSAISVVPTFFKVTQHRAELS